MKKIAVIYWSGTGNTELMAKSVAEGASGDDTVVALLNVSDASIEDVKGADAIALGCPSMGDEVLEETEMEPFVDSLSGFVTDKPTVLFGSYGWGNGEWMEDWDEQMKGFGVHLVKESLILNETPDEDGLELCKSLGAALK